MKEIIFKMPENDAAALINLIGQLPTSSGVYPVLVGLVEQFKSQQAPETPTEE